MPRLIAAALLALLLPAAHAATAPEPVALVHLLDYIAADYAGAVSGGQVRDEGEYREMAEFAATVRKGIAQLPPHAERERLEQAAAALQERVARKAPEAEVATAAGDLRRALVAAYRVAVGPRRAPDLARAALLYAQHCAECHGVAGRGDGPRARGLDPAPSDFADRERQRKRSVHGLYNTI
ncbi:MAG TPA: c-type cytochrome, partial [Gemmatimonadales bacterium]|nr:c-type cytochrome [Gemmatimonadales bacterium]